MVQKQQLAVGGVVVIHLKEWVATMLQQPEDLGVVVHTQTQQALLEHEAKDRQVVMVRLVVTIRAVVAVAQRLPVDLQHQIPATAVMAVQE